MDSTFEALERLSALHKSGVLTDEEFAAEKARVLAGTGKIPAKRSDELVTSGNGSVSDGGSLFNKVRRILLAPESQWRLIQAEAEPPLRKLLNYVLILSAVPAISLFFGYLIVAGEEGADVIGTAAYQAMFFYLLSLIIISAMTVLIASISRRFGASPSIQKASRSLPTRLRRFGFFH